MRDISLHKYVFSIEGTQLSYLVTELQWQKVERWLRKKKLNFMLLLTNRKPDTLQPTANDSIEDHTFQYLLRSLTADRCSQKIPNVHRHTVRRYIDNV